VAFQSDAQIHSRFTPLELPRWSESEEFRRLYAEYEAVDNEVHRIEQEIETPSDAYTETLKHRRARLKDRFGLLAGATAARTARAGAAEGGASTDSRRGPAATGPTGS
jgi:uncharacterized protein YdcH (DUF465 family)